MNGMLRMDMISLGFAVGSAALFLCLLMVIGYLVWARKSDRMAQETAPSAHPTAETPDTPAEGWAQPLTETEAPVDEINGEQDASGSTATLTTEPASEAESSELSALKAELASLTVKLEEASAALQRMQAEKEAAAALEQQLAEKNGEIERLMRDLTDAQARAEALAKKDQTEEPTELTEENQHLSALLKKSNEATLRLRKALDETVDALCRAKGSTSAEYLNNEIGAVLQRLEDLLD